MSHQGHVKLARKAFHPHDGDPLWLEPRVFSRWEAWVDVLQTAAFRDRSHPTKWGAVDLKRGEFVASLRYLAKRWQWSVKRVRVWFSTLCKWARLEARRETQAGTVYLIVNYDRYQSNAKPEGTAEGTDNGIEGAQEGHKKEALKHLSSKKNPLSYDSLFEEAWAAYPSRPGNSKAEAWVQWLRRLKEGAEPLDMLEATRRYRNWVDAQPGMERRHVLMARTFYGPAKRFEDDWTVGAPTAVESGPVVDEFGVLTMRGRKMLEARSA